MGTRTTDLLLVLKSCMGSVLLGDLHVGSVASIRSVGSEEVLEVGVSSELQTATREGDWTRACQPNGERSRRR